MLRRRWRKMVMGKRRKKVMGKRRKVVMVRGRKILRWKQRRILTKIYEKDGKKFLMKNLLISSFNSLKNMSKVISNHEATS